MFFISGEAVALVTLPGVVIHELAHFLACRWTKTPVYEVCYFRFGDPAGYVVHAPAATVGKAVAIGAAPFLVNSLLGALVACPAMISLYGVDDAKGVLDIVLLWLGISVAMHAFPSRGDARVMWAAISDARVGLAAKMLVGPLVGFIHLMAFASIFWADVMYAVAVCMALPALAIHLAT